MLVLMFGHYFSYRHLKGFHDESLHHLFIIADHDDRYRAAPVSGCHLIHVRCVREHILFDKGYVVACQVLTGRSAAFAPGGRIDLDFWVSGCRGRTVAGGVRVRYGKAGKRNHEQGTTGDKAGNVVHGAPPLVHKKDRFAASGLNRSPVSWSTSALLRGCEAPAMGAAICPTVQK